MLTDIQLFERKKGIGGSDAPAICGISRWKTPIDVYLDKINKEIIEKEENEHMYWGNVLEPVIIKRYEENTGKIVSTKNPLMTSIKYPFMIANIDGFIAFDGGILECKTADSRTSNKWGKDDSDFFPEEYLIQCAHYAIVYDSPYVDLAVLIGGNDFRIYKYNRNEILEELIIQKELEFWNENVLNHIPPQPRTEEDFNKIIIETQGNMKNAPQSMQKILNLIKEFDIRINQLKEKKDELSFVIKQSILDYDGLIDEFGNKLCTWKIQETNRFDIAKFKNDNPDIYNKYIKKSKSRVFRIRRD